MEQYTIYCTAEQTNKALKLGAPIEPQTSSTFINILCAFCDDGMYIIPTVEQMIRWLEEQDICIEITMASKNNSYYTLTKLTDIGAIYIKGRSENDYTSRKEATLAAIDAALDYLIKIKD